jgi:hypothetical protein
MKVKALVDITSKNKTISSGTIFNISEQAYIKLAGKVEVLPTVNTMTGEQAAKKISAVLVELDNLRPWPGEWPGILNEHAMKCIRLANDKIDYASDVLRDPEALDAALRDYRKAWFASLEDLPESAIAQIIGESAASCKLMDGIYHMAYTPDSYERHRHLDGQQIFISGVPATIRVKEIAP